MIDEIFAGLSARYKPGKFSEPFSYYFSLGDIKKTVECDSAGCRITDGRVLDNADCVCKTSPEFFLKIWNEGYRPGLKDFMTGTIKSNKPHALQDFLIGFGKN